MSRSSAFVKAWLMGWGALAGVTPCAAQTTGPDSAAATRPDSAPPAPAPVPAADTSRKEAPAPTPALAVAVDSTLAAACLGASGPGIAPGLLVVLFDPSAVPEERAAIVESVQGALEGPAGSGAVYLRVPGAGTDHQLRAIADQLILFAAVRQVGTKACPPR